jgi:hypothetical protein
MRKIPAFTSLRGFQGMMHTFHKPVDGGNRFKWSCSTTKSNKGVCNAFIKVYQKGKAE